MSSGAHSDYKNDAAIVALELAAQLSQPTSMPLRPEDGELLDTCDAFTFGRHKALSSWSCGNGPLVLFVHGWGGRASQFAPLAIELAAQGYRCILFDARGHGSSPADWVGFDTFAEDAGDLCEYVAREPLAIIGHSAGALGLMAARPSGRVHASRYICIAAPLYPYVPIETMQARFPFNESVGECLETILASQLKATWDDLRQGSAYRPLDASQLLLINDKDDPRIRHRDADAIAAKWPGAEVIKTQGLGHNRILSHRPVWEKILEMLRR